MTDCWPLHSPAKPPGVGFRKLHKERKSIMQHAGIVSNITCKNTILGKSIWTR